jgi:alpha-N-arabinofuranosidase
MQSSNTPERTTVRFRPDKANASEWQVDKRIFGKFFEMNGKDTYPGIIDDCIANGSFEEWFAKLKKDGANPPWFQRTEVLYRDTPVTPGLAYPWQPAGESAASGVYEQPEGGVHGKKERRRFQRIHVANGEGAVGIMQRVALSDERTLDYMLRCYTRGTGGLKSLNVSLEDKMGTALTVGTIELKAEWTLTCL